VNLRIQLSKNLAKDGLKKEVDFLSLADSSMDGKTISGHSRIAGIILAVHHFAYNPVIGIGSREGYSIRVGTDGVHSYIALMLANYGLFGFLPFLVFWTVFAHKQRKLGISYLDICVLYVYIVLVMTFDNEFVWWYSLLIVLATASKSSSVMKKHWY
jgi:hypothetical protein